MNAYGWAGVALVALAAFALTLRHSLWQYSRRRLSDRCTRLGRPERFGQILEADDDLTSLSEWTGLSALIGAAACLTLAIAPVWPADPLASVALWVLICLGAFATLVAMPWAFGSVAAEWIVDSAWPVMSAVRALARPLLAASAGITTIVYRVAARKEADEEPDHISNEIASVVDEGERAGAIESEAGAMIQRVVELGEADVLEVMTPRTDVVSMPLSTSLAEAREVFLEVGHSRIPVYGETPDDVKGVLLAKDLLKVPHGETPPLESLLREPLFVPETAKVDVLLEKMKHQRMHIAIVLDEYGGMAGLVTLEDILEEIVGEISDETDLGGPELPWTTLDERTIEVDAKTHVDDLNEAFDYGLPEDQDFETIGGFVLSELDRVPETGETINWQALHIDVLEADKRRIVKLRVRRQEAAAVS